LLPPGVHELEASERSDAYKNAAAGLGAMLQLKSTPADQAKLAVLVQGLRILGESRRAAAVDLSTLIELMGSDDPVLLESLGPLDPKHCKNLAGQLKTMQIMRGELLAPSPDALSAELLFGLGARARPGKTRLSIVSTKFLGDDAGALFYVSQLLLELNRFASRSPSPTLQAAVMFDEADIYLPATSRPPTKAPLESLLKRARSAGVSVMLATQSPGDLDYKCRENVRNWFVGLVKEPRAIDKLRPLLSDAKLDASAVLPKQKVGQFFMLSETTALPIEADRNLVLTEQLSEPEILEIARATRS
jgi:DNA helicase HerA-like ATPase